MGFSDSLGAFFHIQVFQDVNHYYFIKGFALEVSDVVQEAVHQRHAPRGGYDLVSPEGPLLEEFLLVTVERVIGGIRDEVVGRQEEAAGAAGGIGDQAGLIWVVMITSAANRRWPDDLDLEDRYGEAGLPAPSVVRPSKIATIEASAAESIGRLDEARLAVVMETIRRWL